MSSTSNGTYKTKVEGEVMDAHWLCVPKQLKQFAIICIVIFGSY